MSDGISEAYRGTYFKDRSKLHEEPLKTKNMERQEVYKLIDGEREYQNERWKDDHTVSGTHVHTPEEWIVYMEDYLQEAKHILSRNSAPDCYQAAMDIIRKVTAMGVAAMEQIPTSPRAGY